MSVIGSGYDGWMVKFSGDGEDPRVTRTRRDVVRESATALLEDGWAAMTHAEVAKRSGYSKATIYAHWPTPFDLARDAIEQICEDTTHPPAGGDLRTDLHAALTRLAETLADGRYDQLMAGVITRAGESDDARDLRDRLYENATRGIRGILAEHLAPDDVAPSLSLLVGAVLVRATYEGVPVTSGFLDDIIQRVLGARR